MSFSNLFLRFVDYVTFVLNSLSEICAKNISMTSKRMRFIPILLQYLLICLGKDLISLVYAKSKCLRKHMGNKPIGFWIIITRISCSVWSNWSKSQILSALNQPDHKVWKQSVRVSLCLMEGQRSATIQYNAVFRLITQLFFKTQHTYIFKIHT